MISSKATADSRELSDAIPDPKKHNLLRVVQHYAQRFAAGSHRFPALRKTQPGRVLVWLSQNGTSLMPVAQKGGHSDE